MKFGRILGIARKRPTNNRVPMACSCILNRQLLLSRATDDPFNLKEWKVSRQQVKEESSRWVEERSERRTEGTMSGKQKGRLSKLFSSNWPRAFRASSLHLFFNRIIKSPKESRMRKLINLTLKINSANATRFIILSN